MKAALDAIVKITYELRTEPNGEVKDFANNENPFSFLFGHGKVLDTFEKNLNGLAAGDAKRKSKGNFGPDFILAVV